MKRKPQAVDNLKGRTSRKRCVNKGKVGRVRTIELLGHRSWQTALCPLGIDSVGCLEADFLVRWWSKSCVVRSG